MQIKRTYFSRYISGYVDIYEGESLEDKVRSNPTLIHNDNIKIHKTHLLNNKK